MATKPNAAEAPQSLIGRKNIYTCGTCGGHVVTVDVDAGVTPFMIECKAAPMGCQGYMQSSMYRVFDQRMRASWEWYKPTVLEVGQLSEAEQHHVAQGGLLLRRAASVDTHPQGGDANAAPAPLSGAVPAEERADAQKPGQSNEG